MTQQTAPVSAMHQPLTLPSGAILKNRLIKSAMSDSLGDGAGNSTPEQARLYERWALGGAALSIIGEVQIGPHFAEKPGNLVLSTKSDLHALCQLTRRARIDGAHIWPQLGHAGALSHLPISRPKGPSALDIAGLSCAAMSLSDIKALPQQYASAAKIAREAGFSGLQIHAGHGFLLSQFLSPLFNRRLDQYGGEMTARMKIVIEIIEAVRRSVGSAFPIGIKINASDMLEGGLTEQDALLAITLLDKTSIDLIEVSGGTYFPGAKSSADSATSGPYFTDFSRRAKALTNIPIAVTGGFKRRDQVENALLAQDADAIGLARAMALNPNVSHNWQHSAEDLSYPRFDTPPEGGVTAWYSMRLTALATDQEQHFSVDLAAALHAYEARDAQRCAIWNHTFNASVKGSSKKR